MLHFIPPPSEKKKKREEVDDEEMVSIPLHPHTLHTSTPSQENMNQVCDLSKYSRPTQHAMAQLSERDIPFELIEALLGYFRTLNHPGAVLVFLPGWNTIFSLLRQLSAHPLFGGCGHTI